MSEPLDQGRIAQVLEATWPPQHSARLGPFLIRTGGGGGKRVCAASLTGASFDTKDVTDAEAAMQALSQAPLFVIWQGSADAALDGALVQRGYDLVDPVIAYTAPCKTLARPLPDTIAAYPNWPPLALVQDIWAQAGVGPARLAVMARATGAKAAFLLRAGDHPVGVCFAALSGNVAMLHALEILPAQRRQGHGRHLIRAVAAWAQAQGAQNLTLVVTAANTPARRLYAGLGMAEAGHYHYRMRP